jgi:hypothetical protein
MHGTAKATGTACAAFFVNVPVFTAFRQSLVGATAASTLNRYFHSASSADVGNGRVNTRLLGQFSANGMTATAGMRASDPRAGYRQEVCQFVDDRLSPAQTLAFIHQILGRDMTEVRMFLDRIESVAASLTESERQTVVHRGLRRACQRSAGARALPGLCPRRRRAAAQGAHDQAGAQARMAFGRR